tara:strand:+ start:4273 stop:4632 length:360 start_codon:yes stop_codon:yes gene_type:complete
MNIKISTGNYDIVSSGSIVGIHGESIQFEVNTLIFIFDFLTDTKNPKALINKEVIGDKTLKFILVNFYNSLGTRNTVPMSLGKVDNRKLFINFNSYSVTDTSGPIFHYSFLLEKPESDD